MTTALSSERGARYSPSSLGVAVLPGSAFQPSDILCHSDKSNFDKVVDSGMSKSSREQTSERANRALRRRAKVSSEPSSPSKSQQTSKGATRRPKRSAAHRVSPVATCSVKNKELPTKSRKLSRKVGSGRKSEKDNEVVTVLICEASPPTTAESENSLTESIEAKFSDVVAIDESSDINAQDSGADSTSMITDDMEVTDVPPCGSADTYEYIKDDPNCPKHMLYRGSLSASSLRRYRRQVVRSGIQSGNNSPGLKERCFVGNALKDVVLDRKRLKSIACTPISFDELNFLSYPCRDGSSHVKDNPLSDDGLLERLRGYWFELRTSALDKMYDDYENTSCSRITRGMVKLYAKLISTLRPDFLEWIDPKKLNYEDNLKESSSEEIHFRRRSRESETRVCTRRMKREEKQKKQANSSCGSGDSSYQMIHTPVQRSNSEGLRNEKNSRSAWRTSSTYDRRDVMTISSVGIGSLLCSSNFDIVISEEGARAKKALAKSRLRSLSRFGRLFRGDPEIDFAKVECVYHTVPPYNLLCTDEDGDAGGKLTSIEIELLVKELESARIGAIGVRARSYLLNRLRGAVWWKLSANDYHGSEEVMYSEEKDYYNEGRRGALFIPPLPVSFYCEPTAGGRFGEIAGPVKELDEMTEWKLRCYADTEIGSWEVEGLLVPFSTAPRCCLNELKPEISIGSRRIVNRGWMAPEMLDLYECIEKQDPEGLDDVITSAYEHLASPDNVVI